MAFRILQDKQYVDKMLVICPLRPAFIVWPEQCTRFAEFAHLRVCVLHGKDKEALLQSDDYDIYVINPEGLDWLFGASKAGKKMVVNKARLKLVREKFQMLVVDESSKFKNSNTNRFKLLREVVSVFKRRYILTGTPAAKSLMNWFGQVYILDEGSSLGRYITHYRTKYFYPSGFGGYEWTPQPDAMRRIAEATKKLVQVVDDTKGLGLPDILYNDIWVELPPPTRKLYNQMYDELVSLINSGAVVAANAAVASSKCRQIANGCLFTGVGREWEYLHDAKAEALSDLLEQLEGDPALITYEFEPDAIVMENNLGIVSISSGNIKKDTANIRKFAAGQLDVVMGHPTSIALGVDGLQAHCHNLVMYGLTWSGENYEQVINRVARTGNPSKTVTIHRILARNTVDEKVLKVLATDASNQQAFLEALK